MEVLLSNCFKINSEIDQVSGFTRRTCWYNVTELGQKSSNTIVMQLRSAHVGAFRQTIVATNYSIQALECLDHGCNFSPLPSLSCPWDWEEHDGRQSQKKISLIPSFAAI